MNLLNHEQVKDHSKFKLNQYILMNRDKYSLIQYCNKILRIYYFLSLVVSKDTYNCMEKLLKYFSTCLLKLRLSSIFLIFVHLYFVVYIWTNIIFPSLCLTYLTKNNTLWVHPCSHIMARFRPFLQLGDMSLCVSMYHIFFHSSIDDPLACVHALANVNNAAINIRVMFF